MTVNKDQVIGTIKDIGLVVGGAASVVTAFGGSPDAVASINKAVIALTANSDAIATSIVTILTAAGLIYGAFRRLFSQQVERVATMPAADQAAALNKVSDAAKVLIAEAVPNVATVVVKDAAGNGLAKLAQSDDHPNIVTESQNAQDKKGS